ncbi:MAG TPA: riboflavin synthase [Bacteroidota bacterium]|nr:riboflavin synthase [Bacteroidota bacterium]
MFTGIVEEIGRVRSVHVQGDGRRFEIEARKILSGLKVDNSVAVNGTCLTVVRRATKIFALDAVKETLLKTNLGSLRPGSMVNLERPVSLRQTLGGHLVQGHVDATGIVLRRKALLSSWMFTIQFSIKFRKYLIPVGSIAVDGVSLTVARLHRDTFEVAIIPYTFENTIFARYKAGSKVNLEFDIVGKYIESLLHHS